MMNKKTKIILAILAGIDTTITMFTPILLVVLWMSVVELSIWKTYFIFGMGLLATLFRAIKIGFMK